MKSTGPKADDARTQLSDTAAPRGPTRGSFGAFARGDALRRNVSGLQLTLRNELATDFEGYWIYEYFFFCSGFVA